MRRKVIAILNSELELRTRTLLYHCYMYSRHYFRTELRTLFNIHTNSPYFTYDCDNCRLTMYIQQQQRRLSSLLDPRTFTIVVRVKQAQRGLGHVKGNLRMRHIVNTNG